MRVLIVNKFLYPNGGSETYIFRIGKQLAENGHEVQYFGMEDVYKRQVNAFVNYYFLIQEVIFLVFYFLVREGGHLWKKRRLIGSCLLEGILGIAMAGVLFLPSVLFTLENPRLTNHLQVSNWFYGGKMCIRDSQ